MKSPVTWFGGKSQMASMIASQLPDHRIYVEVFGGGASLLFAKPPSPVEVYNDLDSGLVNFFRVLRDTELAPKLYFLASRTPYSREEFLHARDNWRTEHDPVRKAHLWYVTMRMGYASKMASNNGWSRSVFSGKEMSNKNRSWLGSNARLAEAQERLMRVQVEQRDFKKLICDFDSRETLFYLDPPYIHSTRRSGGYDNEMSDEDHTDLVDLMLDMKGLAILSGYDADLYAPLLKAGWKLQKHERLCKVGQHASGRFDHKMAARTECLWFSPGIKLKRQRKAKPCLARPIHARLTRQPHFTPAPKTRELSLCH